DFGQTQDAIDTLCQLLAQDPESAEAHALLAIALVRERRLSVAELEAGQAIHLEPALGFSHYAMGQVRLTQRRLPEAVEHLERGLALGSDGIWTRSALAEAHLLMGDRTKGDAIVEELLSEFAEVAEAHAQAAYFYRLCARTGDAERHARIAISLDPGCAEAVAELGHADLFRGNVEEARRAAIWLLQRNPASEEALSMLALARYRSNPVFGAWFRFVVWLEQLGEVAETRVLLGAWLVVALVRVTLTNLGFERAASLVSYVWIAFCALTWVMPLFAKWAVARELQKVVLSDEF
ncbi:MAG: tetratricopeptide (TPR) repeat protein, partial [Bradymonadia bacterium]